MRMAHAPVDTILIRPPPATPHFGLLMERFQPTANIFASERSPRQDTSINHHDGGHNWWKEDYTLQYFYSYVCWFGFYDLRIHCFDYWHDFRCLNICAYLHIRCTATKVYNRSTNIHRILQPCDKEQWNRSYLHYEWSFPNRRRYWITSSAHCGRQMG